MNKQLQKNRNGEEQKKWRTGELTAAALSAAKILVKLNIKLGEFEADHFRFMKQSRMEFEIKSGYCYSEEHSLNFQI